MIEGLLKSMDEKSLMKLAVGSGILGKFKGKLKELLQDIATEHNCDIKDVGIMIKHGTIKPPADKPTEKPKDEVFFFAYVNGKAVQKYTMEELLAEGAKAK
jgi:hypothetical protein